MSASIYYKNLQLAMLRYVDWVEQSNSLNLLDETVNAENLFCVFLNKAFDWELENANLAKINQDTFDLIDERNGISVQVTSNKKHTDKFKKTITAFQHRKNKKIKHLIVLFLAKKCPPKICKVIKIDGATVEAYDIRILLKKIYYKNKLVPQLQPLNQIFQDATSPVLINSAFPALENARSNYTLPVQKIIIKRTGIYIYRKKLVEDIFLFIQTANGLVVGGPGVGKSFILEELQKFCYKKKVPCFIIRINELLICSDDEINRELNTAIYWVDALKQTSSNNSDFRPLLVFDAFDTAKDEKLKSAILNQIKSAMKSLGDQWNILVSARTFDAAKSTRLLDLFQEVNIVKSITCRCFEIPEISEYELDLALKKRKIIYENVQKCTPELKRLLRVPYFLKLLEKILSDTSHRKVGDLKHIETEEQLLDVFWRRKVSENTTTDLFLRILTNKLTINDSLSCPKSEVITEQNHLVFDHLTSLEVLIESSVTKQNISFSHNILLEFAIAKYIIPEQPELLINYVSEQQKMPFHFRQSFIYFYSKLWKNEKELFWKHYFQVRAKNTPLFRLYHQTILNYILGGFYNNAKDLAPVLEHTNVEERGNAIRRILESIRFINRDKLRDKDFSLLHKVSEIMHTSFLWELGFLIDKSILLLQTSSNRSGFVLMAKASVNYLRFVFEERLIPTNKFLVEANGGYWGIRNVCNTFIYKKVECKKLIKLLLPILNETDFPINFFSILSNNILTIYRNNSGLAILIYKTIYFHTENSDKETLLGNSVVVPLRSNRRQDFDSIHYRLEDEYKKMLQVDSDNAIPFGLAIVNRYTIDRYRYRKIEESHNVTINGIKSKVTADNSFYESRQDKEYGPVSHLENIYDLIGNKFHENKIQIGRSLIKLVIKHADATLVWKKLINLFTRFPKELKTEGSQLLENIPFLILDETVYESGELIKALWPYLSASKKQRLEKTILSIDSSKLLSNNSDIKMRRIERLLSCIPFDELHFSDSKKLLDQNGIKENKPLVNYSGVQRVKSSREERMADVGVVSGDKFELTVFESLEKLKLFTSKYESNNNDDPLKSEFHPLFDLVRQLFDLSKMSKFSNARLKFDCEYEISTYAKIVSRLGDKLSSKHKDFVQSVALYYLELPDYKTAAYEAGDIKHRGGPFSPTPRSSAAQTLIQLMYSDKSGVIAPLVLDLISDNTQIIRFKALRSFTFYWHFHQEKFWQKVAERSRLEKDGMCLHELIQSICYNNIIESNQPAVEQAALNLVQSFQDTDENAGRDIWHEYVVLLLKLLIRYDSKDAGNLIYDHLHLKSFSKQLLFEIITVVDPHNADNNYASDPSRYQILFKIIMDILGDRFKTIKLKGLQDKTIQNDFEVVDYCIQHLCFTVQQGKGNNKGKEVTINNKAAFLNIIKPILSFIVDESAKIESGFMVAHTGYYFMQLLNDLINYDAEFVLSLASSVVKCAAANGFTYDNSTLAEIIKLTEKILADHKELLLNKEHFNSLIIILDLFANSGWQEALELTWRLKEIF